MEAMFSVVLACLVCLSISKHHYSKSYKQIAMKFYGGVQGDTMENWLNSGGDLGLLRGVNEQKKTP